MLSFQNFSKTQGSKNDIMICVFTWTHPHSVVGSSVHSGGAFGSRKSGCWSSFRYFGGVRMWVEPAGDKGQINSEGHVELLKKVLRYTVKDNNKI